MTNTNREHSSDFHCTLDATDTCIVCGVYHGDPCGDCGARGYHAPYCTLTHRPDCSGFKFDAEAAQARKLGSLAALAHKPCGGCR